MSETEETTGKKKMSNMQMFFAFIGAMCTILGMGFSNIILGIAGPLCVIFTIVSVLKKNKK